MAAFLLRNLASINGCAKRRRSFGRSGGNILGASPAWPDCLSSASSSRLGIFDATTGSGGGQQSYDQPMTSPSGNGLLMSVTAGAAARIRLR